MDICEYADYSNFTPQARKVLSTIYELWPTLGRAPTIQEIATSTQLDLVDIQNNLNQLNNHHVKGIELYPASFDIKYAWPFMQQNSLIQARFNLSPSLNPSLNARCAVDALGISSMYNKPVQIDARTPINNHPVQIHINKHSITKGQQGLLVSYANCCNHIHFFKNSAELKKYQELHPGVELEAVSIDQALARGVYVFKEKIKNLI